MEPETIAFLKTTLQGLVSLFFVGTLYMLFSPLLEGNTLKKRMQSVATARENMRQTRMDGLNADGTGLRVEAKGIVRRLVDNLSLEKILEAADLREKLARAGLRGERPIYLFYFFRLFLPVALGITGLIFLVGLNLPDWSMFMRVAVTLIMVMAGFQLPGIYISNLAKKRLSSIVPVFPDALDLLLICVESGMSIEVAFGKVASEMAESSVELASEFSLTTAELSYLQSRRQAYENLARRNDHVGIRAVSTALIQAERYGTPLGDSLRVMAAENRQMRAMLAEKKAASLPAKLTVPMMLFFLPVLFIVILTPVGMRLAEAL